MNESEELLLNEFVSDIIPKRGFLKNFPHDVANDSSYLVEEMHLAIQNNDDYRFELLWPLLWLLPEDKYPVNLLNELLIYPHHDQHQLIAKILQEQKHPSTLPFVQQALDSGFDYLKYTGSDDRVIAKWFSWILAEINTPVSIEMLQQYSASPNEGIRTEMKYRLKQIGIAS